jgi:hydroxyacylglutathione hydrolase
MLEWTAHGPFPGTIVRAAAVGFAAANCYIVADERTREAIVVDPGTESADETADLVSEIRRLGLSVVDIVDTHGHPDHIWGNDALKAAVGGEVAIHELDGLKLTDPVRNGSTLFGLDVCVRPADRLLREGDVLRIGSVALTVLHTPGHSAGGIALLGDGFVLVGDTLFAGSVGRTDLPCSSEEGAISHDVLLRSIREKLFALPDDTVVLPGHGPSTTIGAEKRGNPYVR